MRRSPIRTIAAMVAVAAVLGTGLALTVGATAAAATATGAARGAARATATTTWFQLRSADVGNACVAENGTSSAVAGAPCSSSHTDFWEWTSTGQLRNERSGTCLSVTGSDPGVYLNSCGTNHAQLWLNQPVPVIAGGKLYSYTEFVNLHTRESLTLSVATTGTSVLQQSSGDTLWTLP